MTHKRPIAWRIMASAMIAVPFLVSSGFAQDIGQVPREKTLVMTPWGDRPGPFANIENFNPYLISVDHERNIGHMTYNEALFYTNMNTGELVPWQAESYELNDDFTQATIHLRDGVTWADGAPFTAEDVKFTLETLRDAPPEVNGSAAHKEWVASVEAPDPLTVVITFTKPAPRFVHDEIALVARRPLPDPAQAHLGGPGHRDLHQLRPRQGLPIGTGAYAGQRQPDADDLRPPRRLVGGGDRLPRAAGARAHRAVAAFGRRLDGADADRQPGRRRAADPEGHLRGGAGAEPEPAQLERRGPGLGRAGRLRLSTWSSTTPASPGATPTCTGR